MAGQAQVVEVLCKAGAAVEALDANKATPLHCAAEKGSAAVVQVLIDHGALPPLRQLYGRAFFMHDCTLQLFSTIGQAVGMAWCGSALCVSSLMGTADPAFPWVCRRLGDLPQRLGRHSAPLRQRA